MSMADGAGKDNEDQILDEVYQGDIAPALVPRSRTKFKPWHKPRKHYVRINQWCHETRRLLKILNVGEGGELRYLGFPGEDLLDVRVLKGVCERSKVMLRYLGFDSSMSSPELNLSRHEVNSGQYIQSASVVIADRLEEIAAQNTVAFQYASRHAPFDVINLDLCDSVTNLAENGVIPNLEAIRALCDLQIARRGQQPWLFFLTTRAVRDDLDPKTKQRLFEQLLKNINQSVDFAGALQGTLGLDNGLIQAELAKDGTLNADGWVRTYVLAVSKWLLHYMMDHDYSVSVEMLPSYLYSVHAKRRDMASLAFILHPAVSPRQDETGLTKGRAAVAGKVLDEAELASQMVSRVAEMEDLDEKLANDRDLRERTFTKSAALLARLGYDMTSYRTFANAD
jgi:hypothetical protein